MAMRGHADTEDSTRRWCLITCEIVLESHVHAACIVKAQTQNPGFPQPYVSMSFSRSQCTTQNVYLFLPGAAKETQVIHFSSLLSSFVFFL